MRDGALADVHHLAGAVLAQPGHAVGPDREPDPGPPVQPTVVTWQRPDGHVALDARDAPELLADHGRLETALRVEAGVLPVAATTATRPGVPAAWFDAIGGCHQDLHRVGPGEPGRGLGDPGQHPLPRQRVPDEHHPAATFGCVAGLPGYTPAAVRDLADHQIEEPIGTAGFSRRPSGPARRFHAALPPPGSTTVPRISGARGTPLVC